MKKCWRIESVLRSPHHSEGQFPKSVLGRVAERRQLADIDQQKSATQITEGQYA